MQLECLSISSASASHIIDAHRSIGSSIESLSNARPIVLSRYLPFFRSAIAARMICNLLTAIDGQQACFLHYVPFALRFVYLEFSHRLYGLVRNSASCWNEIERTLKKGKSQEFVRRFIGRTFRKRLSLPASLAIMTQDYMYARAVESAQLFA